MIYKPNKFFIMDIIQVRIMATNFLDQIKELTILLYESVLKAIIFVALFFEDIKIIVTAMMVLVAFDAFTGV